MFPRFMSFFKTPPKENKEAIEYVGLLQDLKNLIRIENYHRSPKVREAIIHFEKELDQTDIPRILHPMIRYYVELGNFGTKKNNLEKKGMDLSYGKTYLLSANSYSANIEGYYYSNEVHICNSDNQLLTFIHETIHFIVENIYDQNIPQPILEWEKLYDFLQWDFELFNIYSKAYPSLVFSKKPETFYSLLRDLFTINICYKKENRISEIPSRIAEFIFKYRNFPSEAELSLRAVDQIKSCFVTFSNYIGIRLREKENQRNKSSFKRTDIYQMLSNSNFKDYHCLDHKKIQQMGIFALHIAASIGNVELLKKLISHPGLKLDEPDRFGNTALHCALKFNQSECITLLVEKGANLSLLDEAGLSGKQYLELYSKQSDSNQQNELTKLLY